MKICHIFYQMMLVILIDNICIIFINDIYFKVIFLHQLKIN